MFTDMHNTRQLLQKSSVALHRLFLITVSLSSQFYWTFVVVAVVAAAAAAADCSSSNPSYARDLQKQHK